MTPEEILVSYLKSELLSIADDVSLSLDENLLDLAPIDSMGIVQLVTYLEQTFNIAIRPGEVTIKNFGTINAMLALIARKQSEA